MLADSLTKQRVFHLDSPVFSHLRFSLASPSQASHNGVVYEPVGQISDTKVTLMRHPDYPIYVSMV